MVATAHEVRFGLMTYEAAAWPELTERWRQHEALGYDGLYAGDHVWSRLQDGRPTRPRFDAWLLVAGIAAATRRVAVGPMVSSLTYRNPVVVAKQAVTADHMSGGRLVLGMGAGGNPSDHATAGVPIWSQAEREQRFAEAVAIVDGLLSESTFAAGGHYYPVEGAVRAPEPVQRPRPPLTVAAHLPATIAVAAHHADTWSSYGTLFSQLRRGITLEPEEALRVTASRSRQLDELAASAGRDPATIRRSFLAGFTTDTPWASPEAFRDFIGRYADIGVSEFVFPYPLQGQVGPGAFERISGEVIPELRAAVRVKVAAA